MVQEMSRTINVFDRLSMNHKLVVITGGAGLLGIKHAEAILEAGGSVLLLDVNSTGLQSAKEQLDHSKLSTFVCDITREESVKESLNYCKKTLAQTPHVLINNAAIDAKVTAHSDDKLFSRLENFSVDQWNLEIAVGLTGSLLCAKIFGAIMAEKKSGVIVNVASDLGLIAPDQRIYHTDGVPEHLQNVKPVTYSVIKHGLIGLTKYLATYWGPCGVRCNAFAPGGVFNEHPQDFVVKFSNLVPMHRMAHIDEYKCSILYLASEASSYMNGAVLVNDGGKSVW